LSAIEQQPAKHKAPCSNHDFDFFYAGLEDQQLLVQKCSGCGELRNPPSPMCGECGSLEWSAVQLSGRGTVYSYIVHHHPPLPGFEMPHPVVLAELEEGIRFLGAGRAEQRDQLAIGKPVSVEYVRRDGVALFQFALDGEAR
jgi:uncharacterized OB-fold protein